MIIDQSAQPCAHKGCACEVPAGQTYCGPHCANAGQDTHTESAETRCTCGHEPCNGNHAAGAVRA